MLAARAGMAPAVVLPGDMADKAGTVDLVGGEVAIPPTSVAARKRPVKGLLRRRLDGPLRAVGGSTARLEGRGAPTGTDAPRGGS